MDYNEAALRMHREHRGKIEIAPKVAVRGRDALSTAYTPGVAEPCREIARDPAAVWELTARGNFVAVVSDGTAVLGLGNIGPLAAMPVMEGKALLFKEFGGVDAVPLCLDVHESADIIAAVRAVAPSFGGINLEDISAPKCFEMRRCSSASSTSRLPRRPARHGHRRLRRAHQRAEGRGPRLADCRIVLNGPGAAGTAITKMLLTLGARDVVVCDRRGALYAGREGLYGHKLALARDTNPRRVSGTLADALRGAEVFIGVSSGGLVTQEMVRSMAPGPVVFAMANPTPEISYAEALAAGAAVAGTGGATVRTR
ncbi:MAG: NADP-dependent malic enzyme [Oscillospiraceae bacterium]